MLFGRSACRSCTGRTTRSWPETPTSTWSSSGPRSRNRAGFLRRPHVEHPARRAGHRPLRGRVAHRRRGGSTGASAAPAARLADHPDSRFARSGEQQLLLRRPPRVRVPIPLHIDQVQRTSLAQAAQWRANTRPVFQRAFALGYRITGFQRDDARDRGLYEIEIPSL